MNKPNSFSELSIIRREQDFVKTMGNIIDKAIEEYRFGKAYEICKGIIFEGKKLDDTGYNDLSEAAQLLILDQTIVLAKNAALEKNDQGIIQDIEEMRLLREPLLNQLGYKQEEQRKIR